jgi:hypothetical protein
MNEMLARGEPLETVARSARSRRRRELCRRRTGFGNTRRLWPSHGRRAAKARAGEERIGAGGRRGGGGAGAGGRREATRRRRKWTAARAAAARRGGRPRSSRGSPRPAAARPGAEACPMAVLTSHDESPSGGSGGYSSTSTRGRRDLAAAAAGVTPRHGKNWRGLFDTPSVLFFILIFFKK